MRAARAFFEAPLCRFFIERGGCFEGGAGCSREDRGKNKKAKNSAK
jgi:hypothetical protein